MSDDDDAALIDDDDASRYDLMLGLQQTRFWLAGIAVILTLILWRVW